MGKEMEEHEGFDVDAMREHEIERENTLDERARKQTERGARQDERGEEQDRRGDASIRKFLDDIETHGSAFGVITHKGYRDLKDQIHNLAKMVLIGMCVQLLVIAYVFYTDYHGRVGQVASAREGCERDKLDRQASVILNSNILNAFEQTDKRVPPSAPRLVALNNIGATTAGLRERGRIDCHARYPDARILP